MSRKDDAIGILPKFLTMIEEDLTKATHYMHEGIKVAIVAEDTETATKLATLYLQAGELTKDFKKLTRKIVD